MKIKLLLIGTAALFLATGTAHSMQHDFSNTWCACNIPEKAMIDREHYYAWIEKCHKRRGTKPRWALPCEPNAEYEPPRRCEPWKPSRVCKQNMRGSPLWFINE